MLAANGLERRPARVKILLTRGEVPGLGLPEAGRPTLVIWAQPYAPPPPAEYAAGWPVAVFPERRSSFIGRHKSLNYLFYLAARQYALDRGAREALILEADGLVSEGSATSLVYLQQGQYFYPGRGQRPARGDGGGPGPGLEPPRSFPWRPRPPPWSSSRQADGVWLANALMGLMPVAAVNGAPVPVSAATTFLQEILADMS